MAHKQGAGSSKNNRDSIAKRRGVKKQKGEFVTPGSILIRQLGLVFKNSVNIYKSKDNTLQTFKKGFVSNLSKRKVCMNDYLLKFPEWV